MADDETALALRVIVERVSSRTGLEPLEVLAVMAEWMHELLNESTDDTDSVARLTKALHQVHEEIDRLHGRGVVYG